MTQKERNKVIVRTSVVGVVVNVAIATVKIVAGLLASSIAIVSEGVNNAADALTSVLTLVGTKLAGRHPDAKHPFGVFSPASWERFKSRWEKGWNARRKKPPRSESCGGFKFP